MAKATFDKVRPLLLQHEGGYVDHPDDPGGATNHGITIGTLSAWRGKRASKEDVKNLTVDEAIAIYRAQYWDTVRGDDLLPGVDYAVYDYAVNSGPAKAASDLQRVVGAPVDGIIGAVTLDRMWKCGKTAGQIVDELCDRRLAYMKRLKNWRTFKRGWTARVAGVRTKALQLAVNIDSHVKPQTKPVPTPKAKPEDTSAMQAWKTPEGVAQGVGAVSGLSALLAGSGPLQWALAAVVVIAALVGAYFILRKLRAST